MYCFCVYVISRSFWGCVLKLEYVYVTISTHLLQFKVFPLREHDLIPHHLHSFFCVHGQICIINTGDVALIHLYG